MRYVRAVRDAGLRRAVVSASANCREVLEAAGIADLFEARVDGIVAEREHLRGKPAPDTYLARGRGARRGAGARRRSSRTRSPAWRPGAPGGFGFVVGVDRVGQADALREHGADIVVSDLAELLA